MDRITRGGWETGRESARARAREQASEREPASEPARERERERARERERERARGEEECLTKGLSELVLFELKGPPPATNKKNKYIYININKYPI